LKIFDGFLVLVLVSFLWASVLKTPAGQRGSVDPAGMILIAIGLIFLSVGMIIGLLYQYFGRAKS
jgi:hypothetical protein